MKIYYELNFFLILKKCFGFFQHDFWNHCFSKIDRKRDSRISIKSLWKILRTFPPLKNLELSANNIWEFY